MARKDENRRGDISISVTTYKRLKAHCDQHGISMRQFVEAVVDDLPRTEPGK